MLNPVRPPIHRIHAVCKPPPGATCASRSPATQQDCRIQWVGSQQQNAAPGLMGASCATVSPTNNGQWKCTMNWVFKQQAAMNTHGLVGDNCQVRGWRGALNCP
jgi:hypothetical protein